MVEVKALYKQYSGRPIFENYSIEIQHQKACITAANGQGKSTLLCMIAGLEPADAGSIETNLNAGSGVALASDSIVFPEFINASQVLSLTTKMFNCDWPQKMIDDFSFTQYLDTRIDALSSGNHKKLQLINAFMRNADILLLDEPNTTLDELSVEVLMSYIEKYEGQCIVASNEPQLFESAGFSIYPLFSN